MSRFSATQLYAVALTLLMCTLSISLGLWHGDAFWHLENGLWMIQHHAVLHQDIWSWTAAGTPWNNLEWGYDLLMGLTYLAAGPYGPIALTVGLMVVTVALSDKLARQGGTTGFWRAFYWTITLLVLVIVIKLRPQMASYALYAGLLLLLPWMETASWKKVAALGLLFGVVWANLHGSYLLGFLIPGFFWVATRLFEKKWHDGYLVWAGAFFAGTFINPSGPRLIYYVITEMGNPLMTSTIQEWQSPNFHNVFLMGILVVVLGALASVALRRQVTGRKAVLWVFVLVLFVAFLDSVRYIPYLVLALPWATGWAWPNMPKEHPLLKRLCQTGAPFVLLASAVFLVIWMPANTMAATASKTTPIKAVSYMKAHHLTCRVFDNYAWGGYLIFNHIRPWIDGRADLYMKTPILLDYLKFDKLLNPSLVLGNPRLRPDVILAQTNLGGRVNPFLWYVRSLGWKTVFHTNTSAVLVPPGGAKPCG